MWTTLKWLEESKNLTPVWKKLMKNVDLGEPTSFLDHVYLGCTQRECEQNDKIVAAYRNMFESRISAGATEQLPGWENSRSKVSAWSCAKMCGTVLRTGQ